MTTTATRIDPATLSDAHRRLRQNVRNFLMCATRAELVKESAISDPVRKRFVEELIGEVDAAGVTSAADRPM